jgi:uncharacterized membrane protein
MNQTHIHLLINHLPLFGSILGGIVLAHALWTRNHQTKIAAYFVLILAALGAGAAYLTGEAAEDTVERIPGISKPMIHEHEDAALFALISSIVLGVMALAGLFLALRKAALTRTVALITLVIALFSFVVVARTAYLGGQIRHTEISNPGPPANGNQDDD